MESDPRSVTTARTDQSPDSDRSFQKDAEAVLRELRPALARVLELLRPPVQRASHLRRVLNLSQQVSWGLFCAATARDAMALPSLLPGRRAMELFFVAAAEQGVPAEAISRARAAFERFEESVARHAGSRDAFETMVSELGDAEPGGSDLKHRRAAFRALSQLLGRQARAFCGVRIMHPSATPGVLDGVFIKGVIGLRRTRRAAPLHTTAHFGRASHAGDPAQIISPEPLDPRETGPDAAGLLRDFCSRPLPEFRLTKDRHGVRSHELVSHRLGPSGDVTYFTGQSLRAESAWPGSVRGAEMTLAKTIDLPLEMHTSDMLLHTSIWDTRPPEVRVYASRVDGSLELRESDLLPMKERAEYLGDGVEAATTPLIPRCAEMLAYAMERMGWNPDEFRVFRCRVEYPVLSTRIVVTLR